MMNRYYFIKQDLYNRTKLDELISTIDPDIVFHLAAESHVDKSIEGPEIFLKSNIPQRETLFFSTFFAKPITFLFFL